jgi:hypothetical protein
MGRIKIKGWTEEYTCGCISREVTFKRELLGYCRHHGANRRHAHPVMDEETAQAIFGNDDEDETTDR